MATDGTRDGIDPAPAARTMDDIARMFLAGARQRAGTQRVAPLPTPSRDQRPAAPPAPAAAPAADVSAPAPLPIVQLAITALSGDAAWADLQNAARHLAAERRKAVALIGEHHGAIRLMRAGDVRHGAVAVSARASDAPIDLQLARALFGMRENVDLWIVALSPASRGRAMDHLLAGVRDWLLVAGTDNASVVAGYRALKNLVAADESDDPCQTRLFLACDDYAHAAVVHARLRRAAGEFLGQDLLLAGVSTRAPAAIESIAEFPLGDDELPAWSSIGEFLHDLSAPAEDEECLAEPGDEPASPRAAVPDPSRASPAASPESAADVAGFASVEPFHAGPIDLSAPLEAMAASADPPSPATPADSGALADPLPAPARPATPPAPTRAAADTPLHAPLLRALETTSLSADALWNVVLQTAGGLCGGEPLEARPPFDCRAALFVDHAGRLHLWTLAAPDGAWLLAWQWAREHRSLLALTRRDRWIDTAADVLAHAVLPPEAPATRLAMPSLAWYRLAAVNLADRTAAVLVPLG